MVDEKYRQLSTKLQVKLFKKEELGRLVFPIQWEDNPMLSGLLKSDSEISRRIIWLNKLMALFYINDQFINNFSNKTKGNNPKEALDHLKKYWSFLNGEVWSKGNPIEQVKVFFSNYKDNYKFTTGKVAEFCKVDWKKELQTPQNDLVQSAMFLETLNRVENLIAFSRAAIWGRSDSIDDVLKYFETKNSKGIIEEFCEYNFPIEKFANLIYRWVFLWGGVLIFEDEEREFSKDLDLLSKEVGLSYETTERMLGIFDRAYSSGAGMFSRKEGKIALKFVPAAHRALGLLHRKSIDSEYYKDFEMFSTDQAYLDYLNKMLAPIGGVNGLKFT
ncbi:MAG: hypothetical protein H6581_22510 [Bacteroidia bacterium]|nr:hypothetical protein [Bacteroidia bacterium]